MKFRFCGDLDCPDWVLSEIATLSKLSSVRIKILVVQVITVCLEGAFNYEKILKLAADSFEGVSDIKGAIAAVHFIVSNAAKHDVDDVSLVQEIQQLGLPKENADAIAKQYRDKRDALRDNFAANSYRITRLLNTEWRVDAVLGTFSCDAAGEHGGCGVGVEQQESPASVVHMKMSVDTRPQDGLLAPTTTADSDTSASKARVQQIAFEMSPEKLDVLIHELTQAQSLLQQSLQT